MKRTFIAVKIPVESELDLMLNKFRKVLENEKIKWVKPDNFHITLYFLGNTEEKLIDPISKEIMNITNKNHSFSLTLSGVGVFKSIYSPKVLWIGIEDYFQLRNIKNDIDRSLESFGFVSDNREFKPHLTFGRPKWILEKNKLKDLLIRYQNQFFQKTEVKEIIFFESKLTKKGPVYNIISKCSLLQV